MAAIRKTVVMRQDDGALLLADTIEYQGKLWIVPTWLEGPAKGTEWPERIICVDGLGLQKAPPQYNADYFLSTPLPKALLEGHGVVQGFVVIERPDIIRNVDAAR